MSMTMDGNEYGCGSGSGFGSDYVLTYMFIVCITPSRVFVANIVCSDVLCCVVLCCAVLWCIRLYRYVSEVVILSVFLMMIIFAFIPPNHKCVHESHMDIFIVALPSTTHTLFFLIRSTTKSASAETRVSRSATGVSVVYAIFTRFCYLHKYIWCAVENGV